MTKEGKIPSKENFDAFLEKLHNSKHIPDAEDAELVTRFEMQQFCPDILITNYSMLEYMLLRPREKKIWDDTKRWLESDPKNKLLFVIDEAHMYRGSAGGEVSLLIRRLFHRLEIDRSRVQFILTTASMPNNDEEDRKAVRDFANALTASDDNHSFCYLTGEKEKLDAKRCNDLPLSHFVGMEAEPFEGDDTQRLDALNHFWSGIPGAPAPFMNVDCACHWLYDHLVAYKPFFVFVRTYIFEIASFTSVRKRRRIDVSVRNFAKRPVCKFFRIYRQSREIDIGYYAFRAPRSAVGGK